MLRPRRPWPSRNTRPFSMACHPRCSSASRRNGARPSATRFSARDGSIAGDLRSPASRSAMSRCWSNRRAATISTRNRPITTRRWCRRIRTSRPMRGSPTASAPTRSSTSASTTPWSGCPGRVAPLAAEILERARAAGIDRDCGIATGEDLPRALQKLDGFLCELKELQIRDGLHVFGESPAGARREALLLAFARARRGAGAEAESLLRALAADLPLGADPLMLDLAEPWLGPRPQALAQQTPPPPPPPLPGR